MADDEAPAANRLISEPPPFVEVLCKSSGKVRRFAAGTDAGFALYLVNKKLDPGDPLAWLIEAAKEGEEAVSFGPNSILVDYGRGWQLQTTTDPEGLKGRGVMPTTALPNPPAVTGSTGAPRPIKRALEPRINFLYLGRIILAFAVIFLFAAILTAALENLPRILERINPSM